MAYDWSGLLREIETYTARRASSLLDEGGEMHRRRRAFGGAMPGEPSQIRYMPTGIASKATRTMSPSEPTIAAILQSPRTSQGEIIALVGALSSDDRAVQDDELRKPGGGRGGSGGATYINRPMVNKRSALPETVDRAAIAAGAQPAVIKVTSAVSSRTSAAGLMTYLGTREVEKENGEKGRVDISLVDQDGCAITSREDRAAVLADWASEFREAYAVNTVATLSITLAEDIGDDDLHDALTATFKAKPFLHSRHPDGRVSVYAVTDLPAKKIASALKARDKGEGPARAVANAEADFTHRLAMAGISADVCILGAAVSAKSGRYFLEKFLCTEKPITTSAGDPMKHSSSIAETADGIWRNWSTYVRTVEPRNAFHVIFSARAGTDVEAMKHAVRDFLSEQVAGHRWITVHHPETSHVHIHAMISARDDVSKALRLTKPELYEWRERFAAKAREHGIAMVATRRADVAATRPYSQAQAGAYQRGRGDPQYLKSSAVKKRVERKRAGVVDRASLANGSLALASKWQATTVALKQAGARPSVVEAAERFAAAAAAKMPEIEARSTKGFVLVRLEMAEPLDRDAASLIVERAGGDREFIAVNDKTIFALLPTEARITRIERELARQNDVAGPRGETQAIVRDLEARLLASGMHATATVDAAGSTRGGKPTPWLREKFDARARAPDTARIGLRAFISDIKQQENTTSLSLEQFDKRVARASTSMDRLEAMTDSAAERQAVEEMRRDLFALFAEQRRDIEMLQMRSATNTGGKRSVPPATRIDEVRAQDRASPSIANAAIVAQQQAIAAGRAARAERERAAAARDAREEQRQETLRQAAQERQVDNGRDGIER